MKKDSSNDFQLYNRDVFNVLLDYEITRSQRYPSPISLLNIMIIPNQPTPEIQQVIDAEVSTKLNSHLRSADIPAKIGEQYLILLPTTDEAGGRTVCERILSIFKGLLITDTGITFSVSVFIGHAFHQGGANLSSDILMQQAVSAMNHAHQQGIPTYTTFSDIHPKANL